MDDANDNEGKKVVGSNPVYIGSSTVSRRTNTIDIAERQKENQFIGCHS